MSKKKKYSEDDIRTFDRSEWFKLRLFKNVKIDSLYVILGFLQEYFGGYSLNNETVDMFFVDEYEKAIVFKELCQYYLSSLDCKNDVKLVKVESGHSYLQSKLICERLKKLFTHKESDFLNHQRFHLSKDNDLYKTAEELYGKQGYLFNFKRYSYLLGVIIKNKIDKKSEINFANSGHKAQLAIEILKEFGAFGDDSFRVDYFFKTPNITNITLSHNNVIWSEVNDYIKLIKTTSNTI